MTQNIVSIQSITRKFDTTREEWFYEVRYSTLNEATGKEDAWGVGSAEDPRPSLIEALQALGPRILVAMKLPPTYANNKHPWGEMDVMQVKWTVDSKGFEYVTVKADRAVGLERPVPIMLPSTMVNMLSDDLRLALGVLKAELVRYILGDRYQSDLFADFDFVPALARELKKVMPDAEIEVDELGNYEIRMNGEVKRVQDGEPDPDGEPDGDSETEEEEAEMATA